MQRLLWIITLGALGYLIVLQRELAAARLRGDMYRDIAARLDRRVVELSEESER